MSQYDQLMAALDPATPARAGDIPRTWWEAGKDTFAALDRGVANVAQGIVGLPVDVLNFVNQFSPAQLTPASWGLRPQVLAQPQVVRDLQAEFRQGSQNIQDALLSEKAKRQAQEFAQTPGFWEATHYAISNPSFLGVAAVEQVPQLAMAVPGRIQATIALQSGLAGSINASQTRAELAPRVAAGELSQAGAEHRAATVFTGTFALNAATSLLPGAQTLERLAAGKITPVPAGHTWTHLATAMVGEAAQGGLSEAGEQILQNLATDKAWSEDTGKAAALGVMLEGPLGGAGRGVEALVSRRVENGPPQITPILQSEGFKRWYGERSIERLEAEYAERHDTDGGRRIDPNARQAPPFFRAGKDSATA